MKIRMHCWLILFSYLFTTKICAAVPDDLLFHNKPIDALCFFNVQGKEIDLEKCGFAKAKYKIKGHNSKLITKGYTGYDWQDPSYPDAPGGYSYYKFFNAGKNMYWVYAINSGGGSGEFTAIHQVKRKNTNTLEIATLVDGDRCNGGVQDVSIVNNQLKFSRNLTAYDLIALSKNASPKVKAYDDLAACAVCCVATAFYKLNSNAELQLSYVDLGAVKDINEMPEQGSLQLCFNKLIATYLAANHTKLQQDMLNEFVSKFNQLCKKSDG